MSTVEHLTELRYRILVSLGALVLCSVIGWYLIPRIVAIIVGMVGPLIFVTPAEAFVSYLKIAFTVGVFFSSPVLFWQAWQFVLPALFPHERAAIARAAPAAIGLFSAGLAFSYFLIVPIVLRFLLGFGTEHLVPALSIGRFLSFFLGVTLPFGLVFEIPLVVLLLTHLELVSLERLRAIRKFVLLGSFVVGAMLTPPDVTSQVLMAIPIIVLYEAALIVAARRERARLHREAYSEG